MKIIAGIYKGRPLKTIISPRLRPTSNLVREMIFNVINHRFNNFVAGGHFLDAFAGTGAMGLEALSRGYQQVTLIEKIPLHAMLIKKNLRELKYTLIVNNFLNIKSFGDSLFSTVFFDPPYESNLQKKALLHLLDTKEALKPNCLLVSEYPKKQTNITSLYEELGIKVSLVKEVGDKEVCFSVIDTRLLS